jgi:hypothetical protein
VKTKLEYTIFYFLALTGWEINKKYDILNSKGQKMFYAAEGLSSPKILHKIELIFFIL